MIRNRFTLVNRSIVRDKQFALHRAGCRDVTKDKHESSGELYAVPEDRTTVEQAIDWWLDQERRDLGYDESDFEVFDCCRRKG